MKFRSYGILQPRTNSETPGASPNTTVPSAANNSTTKSSWLLMVMTRMKGSIGTFVNLEDHLWEPPICGFFPAPFPSLHYEPEFHDPDFAQRPAPADGAERASGFPTDDQSTHS